MKKVGCGAPGPPNAERRALPASLPSPAARNHPGERHVDIGVELLQHGVAAEFAAQADQLQGGGDLLNFCACAERQQQALAVDDAALLVAGAEDGVDRASA